MDRSQNPFLNTLRLPVEMPLSIMVFGCSVHIFALFLPWLSGLALLYKIGLTILLVMSFLYYLRKYHCFLNKQPVSELILGAEDTWQVKMKNGTVYPATPGPVLFVHPWLTIITLKFNNSRMDFLYTPEIIEPDLFRRLRVRLKFKAI